MIVNPNHLVTENVDILIIGGGAAGIGAAVAAAGSGAKVVLLEKNAYAGGNATAAYVGTICGLYLRNKSEEARFAMGGFPLEFSSRLQQESKTHPYQFGQGLHFLPYRRMAFMQVSDQMLAANKVEVHYNASVLDVGHSENEIKTVVAEIGGRLVNFAVKKVVDTSGSALMARLGVSPMVVEKNYQASAQVFGMSGVTMVDDKILTLSIIRSIQRGLSDGIYPEMYQRLSVIPGSYRDGMVFFKLGIPLEVNDTKESKERLEAFAQEAVKFTSNYLKVNCDLFRKASVHMVAPEVGIRTGPRHQGKAVLLKEDVLSAKKCVDGVARGAWPIEFWAPGENPRMEYFAENDYYEIPANCLISSTVENLFFAGRHISAEEDAIASARVIGTCLSTGYAAGKLALGQLEEITLEKTIRDIRENIDSF